MFVFTHWMIGKYFIKKMRYAKKPISKKAFLYGSVYPDLSAQSKVCHSYHQTQSIFNDYLCRAEKSTQIESQSFSLGVVCHYLCDYFCKVHGKKTEHGIKHFFYELELHFHIMKVLSDDLLMSNKTVRNIYRNQGFCQTSLNLEDALAVYYKSDQTMVCDGHYALLSVNQVFKMLYGLNALGIIGYPEAHYISLKKSYIN